MNRSELRRAEWLNPEIRAARVEGNRRAALRRYASAEERKSSAERTTAQFADPDKRARHAAAVAARGARQRARSGERLSKRPEYRVWVMMNQRCYNPRAFGFKNWGGRGITVAPAWRGRGGFARFLAEVGPRPSPEHSVGRKNNAGNYEPGNVRWETRLEQMGNVRTNQMLTIGGETLHVTEWARRAGITAMGLAGRVHRGWPEHRLLEPPKGGRPRRA